MEHGQLHHSRPFFAVGNCRNIFPWPMYVGHFRHHKSWKMHWDNSLTETNHRKRKIQETNTRLCCYYSMCSSNSSGLLYKIKSQSDVLLACSGKIWLHLESVKGVVFPTISIFLPSRVLLKYADCDFPLAVNWDGFYFILFVHTVRFLHGQNLLSSYVNAIVSIPHLIPALYTLVTYYMPVCLEVPM